MSISILREKWKSEKHYYSKQEVGSGSQKFVKEVLKSEELFNLNEGLLSTHINKRNNEFIEEPSKKGNRADVVIFINSEIIIPVEIEKYQYINDGINQLLKYQLNWDKKYGILTDGFTWRFYNNNFYKEISLIEMLENPIEFKYLWEDYIRSDKYYTSYLNLAISPEGGNDKSLSVENNKQLYFEDTTVLINSFKSKLDIAGYFDAEIKLKEKEKKSIEITYAYLIQFILYKVLVDNDYDNFRDDYNTRITSIFKSLNNGNSIIDALTKIQGISNLISDKIYRPFHEEQEYISQTLNKIIYNYPTNEISDVSPWLDILIYIVKYNYANIETDIFGHVYENYLKDQFEEKKMGQFFTDPSISKFMLSELGYNNEVLCERVFNNGEQGISIVDPSCGSGTFLYNAVEKIITSIKKINEAQVINVQELVLENVFGFDTAEFPLYLAEMNIVMRLLPYVINEPPKEPLKEKIRLFKTKDSVAEFIDTYNANTVNFNEQLNLDELLHLDYKSYIRDEDQLKSLKESLLQNENIPRRRFDYVIGNPPYISYNECSKQGLLTFKLIKSKKVKLNNIYGVNLHSIPMYPKGYRPNPNLYAFFFALGIALLKEKGKLAYIVPMTLLVNNDLDVIRYYISKNTTLEKIITFKGKMFINRGMNQNQEVATSSMIIVLSRTSPHKNHKVKILNYIGENNDITDVISSINKDQSIIKKEVLQKELLDNIYDWLFIIKCTNGEYNFIKSYNKKFESFDLYANHHKALKNFNSKFFFDGGYGIAEKNNLSTPPNEGIFYKIPVLNNDYWTIRSFKGFWKNSRNKNEDMYIKLRQGSQGYNFLDSKYKIIWQYNDTGNFFFTDEKVIWALNKYLGIGSDNKSEILYLFAILNSKLTRFIIEKKVILENEDRRGSLFSLRNLKILLRIPKVSSKKRVIKELIIKLVEEMINLESISLEECIDLSKVQMQKLTNIYIENDLLFMKNGNDKIHSKILKEKALIEKIISSLKMPISLKDFKNLPVINKEKQTFIKNYVDDLVFALYFINKIDLGDLNNPDSLKEQCRNNPFYKYL